MTTLSRIVDTDLFRRLATSRSGSAIRSSSTYRRADLRRRAALSRRAATRGDDEFRSVHTAVLFIGHVKSGGSLTGAMLDAHSQAVVSDEIDVVRYVLEGFDRGQLLQLLKRGAAREASKGRITARRLEPYSLAIPGASQGTSTNPLVVGDTRAGPTTRTLHQPGVIERVFEALHPIDVKFVHVVRHPLEPIAAMVRRSGRDPSNATTDYFEQCDRLRDLRSALGDRVLTQHYEDLVDDPVTTLRRLDEFLELPTNEPTLRRCKALIDDSRPLESSKTNAELPGVCELVDRSRPYDFLARYAE